MTWSPADLSDLEQLWSDDKPAFDLGSTSKPASSFFGFRHAWRNHPRITAPVLMHCAVRLDQPDRAEFYGWKRDPVANEALTAAYGSVVVQMLRAWFPVVRATWCIVTPPQGASRVKTRAGVYPARFLAQYVAANMELPLVEALGRTDKKTVHGAYTAMQQSQYVVRRKPDDFAIVIDDMVTSGSTMALALQALHACGVPAMGFSYAVYGAS